jgi:hypothetical protein
MAGRLGRALPDRRDVHRHDTLARGTPGGYAVVEVTDRVTLEFDWDVRANAVIGQPRFTNAASQVTSAASVQGTCPPPTIKGTYEPSRSA